MLRTAHIYVTWCILLFCLLSFTGIISKHICSWFEKAQPRNWSRGQWLYLAISTITVLSWNSIEFTIRNTWYATLRQVGQWARGSHKDRVASLRAIITPKLGPIKPRGAYDSKGHFTLYVYPYRRPGKELSFERWRVLLFMVYFRASSI